MNLKDYSGPVERQREILSERYSVNNCICTKPFSPQLVDGGGKENKLQTFRLFFSVYMYFSGSAAPSSGYTAVKRRNRLVDANEI